MYHIIVLCFYISKNCTLLKGANICHFPSNYDAILLGEGRKGIIKNSGIKEVDETSSDKARKRITIVAKLIIELKSHYQFIFLFLYFVAARLPVHR